MRRPRPSPSPPPPVSPPAAPIQANAITYLPLNNQTCPPGEFVWPLQGCSVIGCAREEKDVPPVLLNACVQPKAGSSSFHQLLIRAYAGGFKGCPSCPRWRGGKQFNAFRGGMADLKRLLGLTTGALHCERWWARAATAQLVWLLIVRDPYVRLLSGYLDKVITPHDSGAEGPQSSLRFPPPNSTAGWRATAEDFGAFVRGLDRIGPNRFIGDADAQMHLLPVTQRSEAQHGCLPPVGQRTAAGFRQRGLQWLRLEEMSLWYPRLLAISPALRAAAMDPEWKHNGRPHECFWAAPHKTCNQSVGTESADAESASTRDGARDGASKEAERVTSYHTTGASDRVSTFYADPETAAAATRWLKGDLEAFGYTEWTARSRGGRRGVFL